MRIDPHLNELYPVAKFSKKGREKLKKNEKWINFDEGDTRQLCQRYWDDAQCDSDRKSFVIEKLFNDIAVVHSHDLGLIPSQNLVLSGDGSAKHFCSSPFGHKVSDPIDDDHAYRYSAPDADIGWDWDLGVWYLGLTMYNISCHNAQLGLDLPVFLSMRPAAQHDALTTISATAQFLDMNPELHPRYMAFDSASDSYDIYKYLRHKNIIPVIDWNPRRSDQKKNPYAEYESIGENGIPVCANNIEMIKDGYDDTKRAMKYRCPYKKGRIADCPFKDKCSSSSYGRVIKIYDSTNYKLFGPLQYKSDQWKEIYKNRTSTERINNRVLNDYGLHKLTSRNGSKNFFFMIMAGINIHMDAWCKCSKV